jgi:hypothetical protein
LGQDGDTRWRLGLVHEQTIIVPSASEPEWCRSNCVYYVWKMRYCITCPIKTWHIWGAYSMEEHKVLFERSFMETRRCAMVLT